MVKALERRSLLAVGAAVTVLALVGAAVLWRVLAEPEGDLTSSSQLAGHGPERAAAAVDGSWRSDGETVGAWLQRTWDTPVEVDRVLLTSDPGAATPVTAGWVAFSDGSRLRVQLDADGETSVAVAPREVTSLRFTVGEVTGDGAPSVGLSELTADGEGDSRAPDPGDQAPAAELSGASADLVDGDPRTAAEVTDDVELVWEEAREVTRLEITGAGGGAAVGGATVEFSDGSTLPVGAVVADPARPTVVAFLARSTTSLTVSLDPAEGSEGPVRLGGLAVLGPGAPAAVPAGAEADGPATPGPAPCEQATARPDDGSGLVVLCPTNGTVVDDRVGLDLAVGQGYDAVSAQVWGTGPSEAPEARAEVDADGRASLGLDAGGLEAGPFTVAVTATGDGVEDTTAYLQLVRPGDLATTPGPGAGGRSAVFVDDFAGPLSVSRGGEGTDYVAGKPENWGVTDFGSAIFADPDLGLGNVTQRDGYLELAVQPRPADLADPNEWGREHVGGMLASARPGGSGFSAQYGLYEARMLAPAAPGTWPAFWTLSTPNLVAEQPVEAEVDVVELYGHDPRGACHTTHQYPDPEQTGEALCGERWPSTREAMGWHTYAVDVRPDRIVYSIDGEVVGTAPQVTAGDEPMFFMLDLALGGGWPIEMGAVRDRASLYVDWVRVSV